MFLRAHQKRGKRKKTNEAESPDEIREPIVQNPGVFA